MHEIELPPPPTPSPPAMPQPEPPLPAPTTQGQPSTQAQDPAQEPSQTAPILSRLSTLLRAPDTRSTSHPAPACAPVLIAAPSPAGDPDYPNATCGGRVVRVGGPPPQAAKTQ